MAGKNAMFGYTWVVEEAVGRLCRCPVAAGCWNWLAQRGGQLIQQSSKSTGKTLIEEGRCGKFVFLPSGFAAAGSGSHLCHLRTPATATESRQIHEKQWAN
nr:hypothetical protein [Belnapia mucosa]